jgi:hypothetical protein
LLIASDILSGRKGQLVDLHIVLKNTAQSWNKIIASYERLRNRSVGYPEAHLQNLLTDVQGKRNESLEQVRKDIDYLEQESRSNGFWLELKGLLLLVVGFIFQVIGTALS